MSKTLVIYYSAQGHTKKIAEEIAKNLEADIFEVIPREKYTEEDLDWTNNNSRATREHADRNFTYIDKDSGEEKTIEVEEMKNNEREFLYE